MKLRTIVTAASVLTLSACNTMTIHPNLDKKLHTAPTYEERKSFYFWGLMGEHSVDVKEICGNQSVRQMQSVATFQDGLLTAITLGIYSPHSVKVWCEQGE